MPRRPLVTERHVLDAAKAGRTDLVVPAGALVTALARDAARAKQVKLVEGATPPGNPGRAVAPLVPPSGEKTLALGCDHAGFDYKAALKAHAESLGWAVTDVGTDGEDAVDYPDFAFAVARLVQSGGARYGLMLDGVGV
ncbi:MAG TPA: RpiB/LacA/LacB family sugar-phosphate isomerase, partial [Rubricoccaceae bacterium]|nr:RpiB/LacA/LacB family sugar-phosphate isomerase [Rubricoccaceae bacterium]